MKKRFNRILGLTLSAFIAAQPLAAAAVHAPQQTTENPLFKRLAFGTLTPFLFSSSGGEDNKFAPSTMARALQAYGTKPEQRSSFLNESVETNSHVVENLFKHKKCVTVSGLVRTVYESLIVNDRTTLERKQAFLQALNPSTLEGALRQVALTEELTLAIACERDEFSIPIDGRLIPQDLSLSHDIALSNSSTYQQLWKKYKFMALRYPLLTLAVLYAPPAYLLYSEGKKVKDWVFPPSDEEKYDKKTSSHEEAIERHTKRLEKTSDPEAQAHFRKLIAGHSRIVADQKAKRDAMFMLFKKAREDKTPLPKSFKQYMQETATVEEKGKTLGYQGNFSPVIVIGSLLKSLSLLRSDDVRDHMRATNWEYLKGTQFEFHMNFMPMVTLGICGWSLWGTLNMFKGYQNQLVAVSRCLKASQAVYLYLQKNNLLQYLAADEQKAFAQIFDKDQQGDTIKRLFDVLATGTFKEPMTSIVPVTYHAGRIGAAATLLGEAKKEIQQLLNAVGHVDYACGIKKLVTESESQQNTAGEPLQYSFVEFVESSEPVVSLENAWFPLYDIKAVPTSIELGGSAKPHHLLLTGVNGTGKSGVMLATINNVIMAMTHGIAPASQARMTPFAHIHSHMNVGDDQGDDKSGFTNEVKLISQLMARIQKNNDANKSRTTPQFFFVVQDETFRSTDKDNAEQLGWGLLNFLNKDQYTLSLCASHLYELAAIEKETNGNFKNAYVHSDVVDGEDGYQVPVHTRKLKFGVNQVRGMAIPIALDALKKEGLLTPQIKALFAAKPPRETAAA